MSGAGLRHLSAMAVYMAAVFIGIAARGIAGLDYLSDGAAVFFWKLVMNPLGGIWGIYCLLPAFLFSTLVIVAVSLCTAPPDEAVAADFEAVRE